MRRLSDETTEYFDSGSRGKGVQRSTEKGGKGERELPQSLGPRSSADLVIRRAPWTSFAATSVDVVIILVLKRSEATNNNHKNKWGKKMLQCTKI